MTSPLSHIVPFGSMTSAGSEPECHEADLVARARTSSDAFAVLYRRHYPAIARYISRRVGDEHTAGDLVAETFLTALQELPRYRERGLPFRSWLYRIATTRVNRWVRRLPQTRIASVIETESAISPDEVEPDELVALVRRELLGLPLRYQSTLVLFYIEGLTVEEIANSLGSRVGTIKARLSRGRERLRKRLGVFVKELKK